MTIPEAAIEATAEALAGRALIPHYSTLSEDGKESWRRLARAAIEAAMPVIREALAQEIEDEVWTDDEGQTTAWRSGKNAGLTDAARIVRGGTP